MTVTQANKTPAVKVNSSIDGYNVQNLTSGRKINIKVQTNSRAILKGVTKIENTFAKSKVKITTGKRYKAVRIENIP